MGKTKKVLAITSSPRANSNSSTLADKILEGAASKGAETDVIQVPKNGVTPCSGCEACHIKKKGCIIIDDMQRFYPKLEEADAYIFASPLYWFYISAQLKSFIDRCYALYDPETHDITFKGKKFAMALSYGDPEHGSAACLDTAENLTSAFESLKAEYAGMVHGFAAAPGEIEANTKLLEEAFQLGIKLVE